MVGHVWQWCSDTYRGHRQYRGGDVNANTYFLRTTVRPLEAAEHCGHLVGFRVDGAILVLEEVFVPWVNIDQALTHLRLAGVFERAAALVVGVPIDCHREDAPDADWDAMIRRCVGGDIPIITNVEFGHTPRKIPFVVGGRITLDLQPTVPVLRYLDDLVTP